MASSLSLVEIGEKKNTNARKSGRVSLDQEEDHEAPQNSEHWQSFDHRPGDKLIENLNDLRTSLRNCLSAEAAPETLSIWSCVAGYCEALATHKKQRYSIFPIPIDALGRLVQLEFRTFLDSLPINSETEHRDAVRIIANCIWQKAIPKPNVQDEIHANSLYVCLRGDIDRKSLDCFGASVVTIAALQILGLDGKLCLSEDHAYETHGDGNKETCEVAIPGNTKLAKSKRAREIVMTFRDQMNKFPHLTPETSWLYMASDAVVCETLGMTLVAVFGNINSTIEKKKKGQFLGSRQLYQLKRELLWVLYDLGHMERFPFGLLELGDSEEHVGSPRSSEWVTSDGLEEPILVNEKLFLDAMRINRALYHEAQVYPYYYAGHYHKDAGRMSLDQEYRLVEAIKMYANAARVTSKYPYEPGAIQLNKHISSVALLMYEDILTIKKEEKLLARDWNEPKNAIDACIWLLAFLDSLLYWEEIQSQYPKNTYQYFIEILKPSHPHFLGKLLANFSDDMRREAIKSLSQNKKEDGGNLRHLLPKLRSKRMSSSSLLVTAIQKPKVVIRETDLAMVFGEAGDDTGGRRSKRVRR